MIQIRSLAVLRLSLIGFVVLPTHPKIYHITHVDNLPSIIADGYLWSDARILQQQNVVQTVGMSHIKQRRLNEIEISCHTGTFVGEYVPFYFCPRSIMLYILHRGNHPDITYREGQLPIVHLQLDLRSVIKWARSSQTRCAFSDISAGAKYAEFFNTWANLSRIDWEAVEATDWQDPVIKERKQAEFLVFEKLPFSLIATIGVLDDTIRARVEAHLKSSEHRPLVQTMPEWYY